MDNMENIPAPLTNFANPLAKDPCISDTENDHENIVSDTTIVCRTCSKVFLQETAKHKKKLQESKEECESGEDTDVMTNPKYVLFSGSNHGDISGDNYEKKSQDDFGEKTESTTVMNSSSNHGIISGGKEGTKIEDVNGYKTEFTTGMVFANNHGDISGDKHPDDKMMGSSTAINSASNYVNISSDNSGSKSEEVTENKIQSTTETYSPKSQRNIPSDNWEEVIDESIYISYQDSASNYHTIHPAKFFDHHDAEVADFAVENITNFSPHQCINASFDTKRCDKPVMVSTSEIKDLVYAGSEWLKEIDTVREIYDVTIKFLYERSDINRCQKFYFAPLFSPFKSKPYQSSPIRLPPQLKKKQEKDVKKVDNDAEISKLRGIITQKIKENERLRSTHSALQKEMKSKVSEIKQHKTKITSLQEEMRQNLCKSREWQNIEFKTAIADKNVENQRLKKELEMIKRREVTKSRRLQQNESRCSKVGNSSLEIRALQRKIKELSDGFSDVQDELKVKNLKIEILMGDLSSERGNCQDLMSELKLKDRELSVQASLLSKFEKRTEISQTDGAEPNLPYVQQQSAILNERMLQLWGAAMNSKTKLAFKRQQKRIVMKTQPSSKLEQGLYRRISHTLVNHSERLNRLEMIQSSSCLHSDSGQDAFFSFSCDSGIDASSSLYCDSAHDDSCIFSSD